MSFSCKFFFKSSKKKTALKNLVEKYFLNKTIVSKPFLAEVKCQLAVELLAYWNSEKNAKDFFLARVRCIVKF